MYKLVLLFCLLINVMAGPFGLEAGLRLPRPPRLPRGCSRGVEGWLACGRANSTDALAPHPSDCQLFYYCRARGPTCRRCPAGLHFSPALHVCDWPASAGCTARPPPPHNSTARPPPPHNSTAAANTTTIGTTAETSPDPTTDATATTSGSTSNATASFTWPAEISWSVT